MVMCDNPVGVDVRNMLLVTSKCRRKPKLTAQYSPFCYTQGGEKQRCQDKAREGVEHNEWHKDVLVVKVPVQVKLSHSPYRFPLDRSRPPKDGLWTWREKECESAKEMHVASGERRRKGLSCQQVWRVSNRCRR